MLSTEEFWSRKQFEPSPGNPSNPGCSSNNIEQWLIARQRIGKQNNDQIGSKHWGRIAFDFYSRVVSRIFLRQYHFKTRVNSLILH